MLLNTYVCTTPPQPPSPLIPPFLPPSPHPTPSGSAAGWSTRARGSTLRSPARPPPAGSPRGAGPVCSRFRLQCGGAVRAIRLGGLSVWFGLKDQNARNQPLPSPLSAPSLRPKIGIVSIFFHFTHLDELLDEDAVVPEGLARLLRGEAEALAGLLVVWRGGGVALGFGVGVDVNRKRSDRVQVQFYQEQRQGQGVNPAIPFIPYS